MRSHSAPTFQRVYSYSSPHADRMLSHPSLELPEVSNSSRSVLGHSPEKGSVRGKNSSKLAVGSEVSIGRFTVCELLVLSMERVMFYRNTHIPYGFCSVSTALSPEPGWRRGSGSSTEQHSQHRPVLNLWNGQGTGFPIEIQLHFQVGPKPSEEDERFAQRSG